MMLPRSTTERTVIGAGVSRCVSLRGTVAALANFAAPVSVSRAPTRRPKGELPIATPSSAISLP